MKPHVVILGAGATIAAIPNGDKNGIQCANSDISGCITVYNDGPWLPYQAPGAGWWRLRQGRVKSRALYRAARAGRGLVCQSVQSWHSYKLALGISLFDSRSRALLRGGNSGL